MTDYRLSYWAKHEGDTPKRLRWLHRLVRWVCAADTVWVRHAFVVTATTDAALAPRCEIQAADEVTLLLAGLTMEEGPFPAPYVPTRTTEEPCNCGRPARWTLTSREWVHIDDGTPAFLDACGSEPCDCERPRCD